MTPAVEISEKQPHAQLPWAKIAWFGALVAVCYAPILAALFRQWGADEDMGHGFFVPVIAAYIVWQRREELLAITPKPNWWGMVVVIWGAAQMIVAVLGAELFTSRTAVVITLIGVIWTLGGNEMLKKLAFPLFLLFFMVPIPAVIYNQITFPLQIFASRLADDALSCIALALNPKARLLIAPAMNGKMWLHAATQANVKLLQARGAAFIGPDEGMLSCGYEGVGRLWPVEQIAAHSLKLLG